MFEIPVASLASIPGAIISASVALASAIWFWRFSVHGKRRQEIAEDGVILFEQIVSRIDWCCLQSHRLPTFNLPVRFTPEELSQSEGLELLILARLDASNDLFEKIEIQKIRFSMFKFFVSYQVFDDLAEYIAEIHTAAKKAIIATRVERSYNAARIKDPTKASEFDQKADKARSELIEAQSILIGEKAKLRRDEVRRNGQKLRAELYSSIRS